LKEKRPLIFKASRNFCQANMDITNEGILLANAIFSDLRPRDHAIRQAELHHASHFFTELDLGLG